MPIPAIHDQDGHVDKLLSSLMLWLSPEIDLQVIGITNGDCYADQAYAAMVKIATYLDLEGAEIAVSEDPVPNPFPVSWRQESYVINELPLFRENDLKKPYQQGPARRSSVAYADCLSHSKQRMTLVVTGPLTNIALLFKEHPELKSKIAEIVIMGGAISAAGNVQDSEANGNAEWNIYADTDAFKAVLESKIPIKLITLDVTNQLPVGDEFLARLSEQANRYKASLLAAKLWSLVKGFEYYHWDTATAAAVIAPHLFTFKEMRIDVTTQGKNRGKISAALLGGCKVKIATEVEKSKLEELLLDIFKSK